MAAQREAAAYLGNRRARPVKVVEQQQPLAFRQAPVYGKRIFQDRCPLFEVEHVLQLPRALDLLDAFVA